MTVPPDVSDVECLRVNGELVPLLKCPFCKFRNIHEDTIRHHIRWSNDIPHWGIDLNKIEKIEYYANRNRKKSHYHYEKKDDYGLPWIKCLWCTYDDNVIRDLEWHFMENHRNQLYRLHIDAEWRKKAHRDWIAGDPFYWMYNQIDYMLYRAARLAKEKSGII